MSQKSSLFVKKTRENETWLAAAVEEAGGDAREREQLLATAALAKGALDTLPVPEEAEEHSRCLALKVLDDPGWQGENRKELRAPWYLRVGHLMRLVFTLGRRR
jgi:hypothetical protein